MEIRLHFTSTARHPLISKSLLQVHSCLCCSSSSIVSHLPPLQYMLLILGLPPLHQKEYFFRCCRFQLLSICTEKPPAPVPTLQSANGNAKASKCATFSISTHLKLHTGGPHVGHVGGAAEDSLPV